MYTNTQTTARESSVCSTTHDKHALKAIQIVTVRVARVNLLCMIVQLYNLLEILSDHCTNPTIINGRNDIETHWFPWKGVVIYQEDAYTSDSWMSSCFAATFAYTQYQFQFRPNRPPTPWAHLSLRNRFLAQDNCNCLFTLCELSCASLALRRLCDTPGKLSIQAIGRSAPTCG